ASMTVPPVNSIDRCRPRVNRKNTAARNTTIDTALSIFAWRMKGISFLMRKNSIISSRSGYPWGCPSILLVLVPDGANGYLSQFLLAAIPKVDHRARHYNGREHGSQDTQRMHDSKTAHRPAAEDQQCHRSNQCRDVRVQDRGPRTLESGMNGRLRRNTCPQLF